VTAYDKLRRTYKGPKSCGSCGHFSRDWLSPKHGTCLHGWQKDTDLGCDNLNLPFKDFNHLGGGALPHHKNPDNWDGRGNARTHEPAGEKS
jgi:hypothetical protein